MTSLASRPRSPRTADPRARSSAQADVAGHLVARREDELRLATDIAPLRTDVDRRRTSAGLTLSLSHPRKRKRGPVAENLTRSWHGPRSPHERAQPLGADDVEG